MSKPRKQAEIPVSLFPFLSVLACVIGVLTLMLSALAIGQIEKPPPPPPRPNVDNSPIRIEFKEVQGKIKADEERKAELDRLIAEAESVRKQLADARAELARLKALQDKDGVGGRAMVVLLKEHARVREQVEALEAQLTALEAEIKDKEAKLGKVTPPGEPVVVVVPPMGSGRNLKPRLIECTADGLVIHPELKRVQRADIRDGAELLDVCREVQAHETDTVKWSVIFLIRPDGVESFREAQTVVDGQNARNGKLPIPGHGLLDLSRVLPAGK